MWQTIISIDKNYVKEYEFIIGSLNKINGRPRRMILKAGTI